MIEIRSCVAILLGTENLEEVNRMKLFSVVKKIFPSFFILYLVKFGSTNPVGLGGETKAEERSIISESADLISGGVMIGGGNREIAFEGNTPHLVSNLIILKMENPNSPLHLPGFIPHTFQTFNLEPTKNRKVTMRSKRSVASGTNGRRRLSHNNINEANQSSMTQTREDGNNDLQSGGEFELSSGLLGELRGNQDVRKAILEIRIRVEGNKKQGPSGKGRKKITVLPFLIRRLESGEAVIVSRGQERESRPTLSPQIGVNHSGRIHTATRITRYEFQITNLLQKTTKRIKNRTENVEDFLSFPIWRMPRIELSVVCLKKRKFISCEKNGVSLEESPTFLFYTVPGSNTTNSQ